jgi:hypothetical protein
MATLAIMCGEVNGANTVFCDEKHSTWGIFGYAAPSPGEAWFFQGCPKLIES